MVNAERTILQFYKILKSNLKPSPTSVRCDRILFSLLLMGAPQKGKFISLLWSGMDNKGIV